MRGYSIDENVRSEATGGTATFDAGINENVVLKKVSYTLASMKEDADPNGAKVLAFEFEKEVNGEIIQFRHTEWEINDQREVESAEKLYDVLVSQGKTPKESKAEFVNMQVDKKYNQFAARIKHIMTKYMSEEDSVIPACNSFAQFANMVSTMLTPHIDDRKMRMICVYNYKGYITLPTFVPFLEVMVDGEEGVLHTKLNPRYHKLTPPAPQNTDAVVSKSVSDDDEF